MDIAIVENGNIVSIGDYHTVFPNTSFTSDGPTDEFLAENNAKRVNLYKEHDSLTQCLEQSAPYVEGDWVYKVSVRALTDEEIQNQKATAMNQIRSRRDQLLSVCDWTQVVDTPVNTKLTWVTYRQQLRDLPSTITEPRTFTDWPKQP